MSKVKCYSYVRYSSELQRLNSSLSRQLEKSKSYADKHNLQLITDYQDLGISGYQGNKQDALAKLKLAIANGTIAQGSLILIEEFDRLSRAKPAEAQIQFFELLKSGVNIVTLVDEEVFTWESIEEKPQQLFISLIKSISAHDESKKKSERVRNAWQKKREAMANGKPLTKKVPFWISWDDKSNNFVLNNLAISFKLAFKMSIEHGHGSYYISKFLNLNNYPAPIGNFHKSYILKTLHNVAAYGCYVTPNIDPIDGYFPPLISKEEFELNLALMKSRDKRGGRIGKGFPNIFTGKLIYCANCEGRMVYRSKGVGFRNSRFLHCSNSERSNISVCSCPIFNYIEFETFFMKFITELDIDTLFNKDSIEHNQKVINEITVLELEIQKIEHQYSNIIASLDDAPEEIRQDIYKSAISKKAGIKTINEKILKLRYEIHTSNKENDSVVLKDNIQKYDEYTKDKALDQITEIRRDLNNQILSVISKITIFNDFKFTDNNTNNIPNTILDIAHKRGYNTEEKKVKYFQSAKAGKKLFNEYYRFFIVEFKNGQKKHVVPFLDYSKSTDQVIQAQIERQKLLAENLKKLKEKYGIEIDLDKLVNL